MRLEWDADELLKATHWNDIAFQIEYDLIRNRARYEHSYDKMHCCRTENNEPDESEPKDDFERGVKAALSKIILNQHPKLKYEGNFTISDPNVYECPKCGGDFIEGYDEPAPDIFYPDGEFYCESCKFIGTFIYE